jgi:hypothetical protein
MTNYFIHAMEHAHLGDYIVANDIRCFGYSPELPQVHKWIEEKQGDLHNDLYNYIVIYEVESGIQAPATEVTWYKWDYDEGKWLEIPRPEPAEGFTISLIG